MTKNKLKYTFILLLCLAISEIINGIIFVLSLGKDNYFNGSEEGLMILISLILYFVTGKFIVSKFNDKKSKNRALLVTGIIIVLSYLFSMGISINTGQYYLIHMTICSPVGAFMAGPAENIPYLYELLLTLFSPVSVLLIWIFSYPLKEIVKCFKRKKENKY